jgi:Toprim domain
MMERGDATDIAHRLAAHIQALAVLLLPNGGREGQEWRVGNVNGEPGHSLAVHLSGAKAGLWADFSGAEKGDALDLIKATRKLDTSAALEWARRWLAVDRSRMPPASRPRERPGPPRWQPTWQAARPIAGTIAELYLAGRRLRFDDPEGRVLRFDPRRARRGPGSNQLEHHPALLALLRDVCTGRAVGMSNIHLAPDGSDRLRDKKAKTVTGQAAGAAVMLSAFGEPTGGLLVCEGVETGIAVFAAGLRPLWACGGAGTLTTFPLLGGIEALTIAADADPAGMQAAERVAERWRQAGREARIVAPLAGDWADAV